jgi:6-methylsalicylate decarboxylase
MAGRFIDVHHHLASTSYLELAIQRTDLRGHQERMLRNGTPAKSLEDMDRAGVAMSMISLTTPGVWFNDRDEARRLARECNDHFARVVSDHRGRYGMFAVLPLPDVDGSLREIEYALDVLKADGIGFYTSYENRHLGDPAFTPILAELNRRKAVAYTHPVRPDCCTPLLPGITEAAVEYCTDTTRTIASLAFTGAATRFPDIRWIFSHAGGTMPFLISRFLGVARAPEIARHLPQGLLPVLRGFYYDLAQSAHIGAVFALMQIVELSQILFGTDFPYGSAKDHLDGLAKCKLSAEQMTAIGNVNAARLLPRSA